MNYAYVAVLTGNLICFVTGLSITWSSPELEKFQDLDESPFERYLTEDEKSWISSLLALGAAFGPFLFGYLADKIGRKLTMLVLAIPYSVSYFLMAFSQKVEIFYIARLLSGFSVGGVFAVVPIYICEVAEDSIRGALASSMNCFVCFGLLVSYSLGAYTSVMVFNLFLAIIPIVFFVLFFIFAPETPHYYLSKDDRKKAEESLRKLRGVTDSNKAELNEMEDTVKQAGNGSFLDIFKSKGLIKAFIISGTLVSFQQLSGITAILSYAAKIFEDAGVDLSPAVCAIIIGATQFITSFITPLVADKLGRKILLVLSAIGMVLTELPLGIYFILRDNGTDVKSISFLPIVCLVLYIIVYNSGFGPLPWTVMGEVFPLNVKSSASTATACLCWLMAFLITYFFQKIARAVGIGVLFLVFSGLCFGAAAFSQFYLIETKAKSLQQIQNDLNS